MTVHKAKGLEFPLTVIADAAYEPRPRGVKVQVDTSGLLLDVKDGDLHPCAWQIAARLDGELEDAEDRRLLYVAATRAKEKLLISGHVKAKKDGSLSIAGWLGTLGLQQIKLDGELSGPCLIPLDRPGLSLTLYPVLPANGPGSPAPAPVKQAVPASRPDLVAPLSAIGTMSDEKARTREKDLSGRVWRVVPDAKRPHAPAWVVGTLVHEALRRWRFPDDGFDDFLLPIALEAGLADQGEIRAALQEARRLLERFRTHPLFAELDQAERHHEVPYFTSAGRGIIDLLYRSGEEWMIIDFKTDQADSPAEAEELIRRDGYDQQLGHYARAVAEQLGVRAKTRIVFLNVKGHPAIFEL
jgi:ATP-dependent exoDNAse (exonuclease V) beta subunit